VSRVTAEQLVALARKYRVLTTLREAREAAIAQGLTEFPDDEKLPRRAAMKAVAAEFPGALRELDEASAEELRLRRDALDRGERTEWMEAAVLFHWALREALMLRRGSLQEPTYWREPFVSDSLREQVLRPPTGRVLDVVWTAVARELGITPRAAEQRVYPKAPPRGARA
jgi:hypothetical protein